MKKISIFGLAMTFAGCFLGAGYVSGQELWQFFGSFGEGGFAGLILAMVLMFAFGALLIWLTMKTGITEMDAIIIKWDIPWLKTAVGIIETVFLFFVYIIMAAGTASLIEQMLGIPRIFGGAAFCALVVLASVYGVEGVIRVFSCIVPILVVCTVLIGGYIVATNGFAGVPAAEKARNPLITNWVVSAGTYVAYNIFGSVGILTPIGLRVDSSKKLIKGLAAGALLLLLIAGSILSALWALPGAAGEALPMLSLACNVHMAVGYGYAFLLFCGMFGGSLSAVVALDEYLKQKIRFVAKHRMLVIVILSVLAWAGSLVGFSELIGTVYPIFGYFGIAALVLIAIHFFKVHKKRI